MAIPAIVTHSAHRSSRAIPREGMPLGMPMFGWLERNARRLVETTGKDVQVADPSSQRPISSTPQQSAS